MEKISLNIGTQIADAITTYNQAGEAHRNLYELAHADYVKMSHDDRYKPEYCRRELSAACDSADVQLSEIAAKLNADLLKLAKNARPAVENKLSETSIDAGYSARKSFALQAIQALGAEITDEDAAAITKEFRRDLPAMRLFHKIIEKQVDPEKIHAFTDPAFALVASADRPALVEAVGNGVTGFHATFDYMVRANRVLELLDSLADIAEKAFTSAPTASSDELPLGGGPTDVLHLPMTSLTELMRIEQLKKVAQQAETVLNFMDICGDFE